METSLVYFTISLFKMQAESIKKIQKKRKKNKTKVITFKKKALLWGSALVLP